MLKREMIDTLGMIQDICCKQSSCSDCSLYNRTEVDCMLCEYPRDWIIENMANILLPTITHDEYIILKNFPEGMKEYYIARDSKTNGNILNLYINKPQKHESGRWTQTICNIYSLIEFQHIFKIIKWEDEEPKKVSDLIKEYEEVHGICS